MQSRQAETPAGRAWTESQEQAITVRGKDILVSAAAGAGKTSVLVERIVRRLLDPERPVDIDRLLVVTFTESAAQEMKERVRARLEAAALDGDERAAGQLALLGKAAISTLHSFSLDLVRRYAYLLGVDPRFRFSSTRKRQTSSSSRPWRSSSKRCTKAGTRRSVRWLTTTPGGGTTGT